MRTSLKNLRPKGFLLLVVLLAAASIGAGSVRRPYGEVASKEVLRPFAPQDGRGTAPTEASDHPLAWAELQYAGSP